MIAPLDDLEFLARSEHRFQVLEKLSRRPCERAELQRELAVSRTTISRTLSDMDAKGWVRSEGWQYQLTALGELIYEEFEGALDTVDTVQTLSQVFEWMPIEEIDLDLRYFHDATVSVASRTYPTLPIRKFADLKATDGHVQAIIYAVDPFQLAEHRRATEETNRQLEIVFSAGFYEKLLENPDTAREVSEAAANEQSDYYLCNDESPLELVVTEDTVGLLLANSEGTFQAIIECQHEAVISWAEDTFEMYQENSTLLSPEDISPDDHVSAIPSIDSRYSNN